MTVVMYLTRRKGRDPCKMVRLDDDEPATKGFIFRMTLTTSETYEVDMRRRYPQP